MMNILYRAILQCSLVLLMLLISSFPTLGQSEGEAAGHDLEIVRATVNGKPRRVLTGDRITVFTAEGQRHKGRYDGADSLSLQVNDTRIRHDAITRLRVPGRREAKAMRWLVLLIETLSMLASLGFSVAYIAMLFGGPYMMGTAWELTFWIGFFGMVGFAVLGLIAILAYVLRALIPKAFDMQKWTSRQGAALPARSKRR